MVLRPPRPFGHPSTGGELPPRPDGHPSKEGELFRSPSSASSFANDSYGWEFLGLRAKSTLEIISKGKGQQQQNHPEDGRGDGPVPLQVIGVNLFLLFYTFRQPRPGLCRNPLLAQGVEGDPQSCYRIPAGPNQGVGHFFKEDPGQGDPKRCQRLPQKGHKGLRSLPVNPIGVEDDVALAGGRIPSGEDEIGQGCKE